MVNKSYAIGYRFEQRVKKHMEKFGWNVIRRGKSAFPDLLCWKPIQSQSFGLYYDVHMIECKCNKYLSKEEKAKVKQLLEEDKCQRFVVAYRKNRKLLFYEVKKEAQK